MPIVGISTFPYYVYDGTTGVLVNSSADVAAMFNLMNFGGSSAWVANAVNGGVYVTGATSSYNNLSATVSFRYSDNINGIGGTCRVYNIGANGQCLSKP